MADAIRIGDPAIEIRLRRNARARRMVLRVAHAGRGPTLTLPPGVPIAQARAFLSDQEGWLRRHLAARPRGGGGRATGTVLPFGDRDADDPRRGRAGDACMPAACWRCRGRPSGHAAAGRRLAARGGAAGLRRGGGAARGAARAAAGADQPARSALALGVVHGERGSDVLLAAGHGAGGGARLRGGARGGASRRAQPLAAVLGGGAAALPGLSRPRATGCGGTARRCTPTTSAGRRGADAPRAR